MAQPVLFVCKHAPPSTRLTQHLRLKIQSAACISCVKPSPVYTVYTAAVGPNQPSIQRVPGFFPWSVMLTAHLHLALRSRMSGAIPLLVQYAFVAWTGTNLPFQRRYPICAVNTYISITKIAFLLQFFAHHTSDIRKCRLQHGRSSIPI